MTALIVSILVSLPMAPPTPVLEAAAHVEPAKGGISGRATWYGADGMIAAAGPGLRSYLGKGWRNTRLNVSSGGKTITVLVNDWCDCRGRGSERLIDLSDDAFRQLAPLSTGVIHVTASPASARSVTKPGRIPKPPATDTN